MSKQLHTVAIRGFKQGVDLHLKITLVKKLWYDGQEENLYPKFKYRMTKQFLLLHVNVFRSDTAYINEL